MTQRSKTKGRKASPFKRSGHQGRRTPDRTPQGGTTFGPAFVNEGPVSQKNTKNSTVSGPQPPSEAPARPSTDHQIPAQDYVRQASGKNSKNFTKLPAEVLRLL